MSEPITAKALEQLLRNHAADVEKGVRGVGPVGVNIGVNELQLFLGCDARREPAIFAARAVAYFTAHGLIDEFSALIRQDHVAAAQKAARKAIAQDLGMHMTQEVAQRLMNETIAARCAILSDGAPKGSGCLVSPRLVLTCAHVLGEARADGSFPPVEVVLSTNMRVGTDDRPVKFSVQAKADNKLPLSGNDTDFANADDFALLRMRLPAGANATVAQIETDDWTPKGSDLVTLFHFPDGKDQGIGFGLITKFDEPSVRWSYRSETQGGSSGGGCFNVNGALIGLHQGVMDPDKSKKIGRLIPYRRFRDIIAPEIAADLAPAHLWSVDGHLDGTLVIGREALFTAFAKLGERGSTYRTLRVRRLDPAQGGEGLGYTVSLVQKLIQRRTDGHSAITLGWPQVLQQDFDVIARLAQLALARGLAVPAPDAAGSAADPAGSARTLLRALDEAAATTGETLWIVIEHSPTPLGGQTAALEALASEIPLWPNMRLVLVGNESVSLAGPEFRVSDIGASDLPGVALVEYIRPFERGAIEAFIDLIHKDFVGEKPSARQRAIWTDHVLNGLTETSGSYALADLPEVARRLRRKFLEITPMAQAA